MNNSPTPPVPSQLKEEMKACCHGTCPTAVHVRTMFSDIGWQVQCGCGARGPLGDTRKEAVELWNVRARDVEVARLREALEPFAACEVDSYRASIPDEVTWLWKPSQTSRDLPGISVAHIKKAKTALGRSQKDGGSK